MAAKLYIVATPIGNLGDITLRAIEVLKSVSQVAVEDTRQSRKLWNKYGITTSMQILNKDNEHVVVEKLIYTLEQGNDIALISDAGTPLIHDPGSLLVRAARQQGVDVVPIPGACALIAALCVSGLDASNFTYCGFLHAKQSVRMTELDAVKDEERTLVFYEAPHRLLKTLHSMADVFGGERIVVLAREITKIHEEVVSCSLSDLVLKIDSGDIICKGEMVVLVQGASKKLLSNDTCIDLDLFLKKSLKYLSVKDSVKLAGDIFDLSSNIIYKKALEIKESGD
jgi:16S rRNA (cytidine1402-2'-O)-methyltransferase